MPVPFQVNYCPRCGAALADAFRYGKMRRMCGACDFVYFHDPKVAVVIFTVQAGKVLLVRRGVEPQIDRWALPAGYVDYGEDPRAAAIREMKEETGLEVCITTLVDVLGPDIEEGSHSIAILFEAEVNGGSLQAGDDVIEVGFFAPDQIPTGQLAFESTRRLLYRWLNRPGQADDADSLPPTPAP